MCVCPLYDNYMYIHSHILCMFTCYHMHIYMIKYRMYPAIIWADSPATISMPNSAYPPGSMAFLEEQKAQCLKELLKWRRRQCRWDQPRGD